MKDLDVLKLAPNHCFKCNNKEFIIEKKEAPVFKTIIIDLPHIKCTSCGTSYLIDFVIMRLEKRLMQQKNYKNKMTYEEAFKLINTSEGEKGDEK